MVLTAKII